MEFALISLLNGVSYGMLLFMLSSGLTLIFGMMGVLNFAHASFYMLGAYFAFQVSSSLGWWPALLMVPLLVGLLGAGVERFGLRRVHRFGHVAELLFTFGLAFMIEEIVHLAWGRNAVDYAVPAELDGTLFTLFDTAFPVYRGLMILISAGMMATLYLLLTRTRIGLVIQAALTHPEMAESLGHNVPRVFMLSFGMGCAMAGLAGVIGGNAFVTEPSMAAAMGSIVFVIVVVGGLGSMGGALAASLLIGVLQTFAVGVEWRPLAALGPGAAGSVLQQLAALKLSQMAPILPYLLMVAMLIVRPRGLMGQRED